MAVKWRDQGRQSDGAYRWEFLPSTTTVLFEDFVAKVAQEELINVFRSVLDTIHQQNLTDYHLKIQNGWHGSRWKVVVLHGDARPGPWVCSQCMSCDLDCPLTLGITGHGQDGMLVTKQ